MKAAQLFSIDGQIDQSIDQFNRTAGHTWPMMRLYMHVVFTGG